jgi:TonB family protein
MKCKVIVAVGISVLVFAATLPLSGQTQNPPFRVGGDVIAPRPLNHPNPEYSEEARVAGLSGTCILSLIVDPDGRPRDARVSRSLGMGLDQKAIEAVRGWTFEPARKDGNPVAVEINIAVSFRLFKNGTATILPPEWLERAAEERSRVQSRIYRLSDSPTSRHCQSSSSDQGHTPITIANLTFDGEFTTAPTDRNQISASVTNHEYFGDLDEVTYQVVETVKSGWQEHGYFKAQVHGDARTLSSNPVSRRVAIAVHVDEGHQYRLGRIAFRNNKVITNLRALRGLFPIADGDVFDSQQISKGLENLKQAYRGQGFVNFTPFPQTQIDERTQTVSLEVDCDEGKQFSVEHIDILGLDESAFETVRKDLFVKPGDIYNERLVNLSLEKYAVLIPNDGSLEPRLNLRLDEQDSTLAITYDFRHCAGE